ncbi:MAG TPA: hypothetical protein VGM90_38805 [Kofleriaceae bacterium]|jgi:hypothetical protein
MRFRSYELCLGVLTTCVVAGTALAQSPALDETKPTTTPAGESPTTTADPNKIDPSLDPNKPDLDPVKYGVDIRFRNVRVPKSILDLFLERSAGGASSLGIGVDFVRRRGTVELQLGFEYEHLQVGQGVWIDSGDDVAVQGTEADYVLNPDHNQGGDRLGWFTMEFTFLNHAPINKYIAVRYGGGAGLGILTGDLQHYDVHGCSSGATNSHPEPGCVPTANGGTASNFSGPVKYNLPPVFPVINAIIGVQITPPVKGLVVNLETGIRTAPFFGTSIGYFF